MVGSQGGGAEGVEAEGGGGEEGAGLAAKDGRAGSASQT